MGVPAAQPEAAWPDPRQRGRALTSLVADGLAGALPAGSPALPAEPCP